MQSGRAVLFDVRSEKRIASMGGGWIGGDAGGPQGFDHVTELARRRATAGVRECGRAAHRVERMAGFPMATVSKAHQRVLSVQFASDGRIVSVARDAMIRVWKRRWKGARRESCYTTRC